MESTNSVKRNKSDRVLYIRDLNISFETAYGTVRAIRGVRLDLFKGETIAIVGESGSGKSVTVKTIMGILDSNGVINSGQIIYRYTDENGEQQEVDLVKMSQKDIRYKYCGKHIAMVFQDPMTSLDPTMTVGRQIMEPMREHYSISRAEAKKRAMELLEEVGIDNPDKRFKQFPHELSGGMRQRVVIAIALACDPDILICDEPTTALDVTIQAQILELINKLKAERNLSIIFITHDLGVVAQMADEIAVMYAGQIVEQGLSEEVFYDPRHPYTWALLSSMPDLDTKEKLEAIPGTPPNMIYPPVGDAFADRNKYAMEIDFEQQPPMFDITETHRAATWLLHPDAPKVEMPKIITERIERMKAKLTEGQNG